MFMYINILNIHLGYLKPCVAYKNPDYIQSFRPVFYLHFRWLLTTTPTMLSFTTFFAKQVLEFILTPFSLTFLL